MKTHFVCIIFHRLNPKTTALEFLVQNYRFFDRRTGWRSRLHTKFPGGTNRDHPGEPVPLTRDREAFEETNIFFSKSKEIWREPGRGHTRYGFLVDWADCCGTLREHTVFDGRDELSPPWWADAQTLGRELSDSHQSVYLVASRYFGII